MNPPNEKESEALKEAKFQIAQQLNRQSMNTLAETLARSLVEIETLKTTVADLEKKLGVKPDEKA